MSTLTFAPQFLGFPSLSEMRDALDLFWQAHYAAEELRGNLTREQQAGVADVPAGLEYWDGEARARYESLLTAFGIDPGDDGDTFGSLADLYARPQPRPTVPSGPASWDRGRGA